MKRAAITIFAIAILGLVGFAAKAGGSGQPASLVQGGQSTTAASPDTSQSTASASNSAKTFRDGTYTGDSEDTPYGAVQIAVVISGGRISDVNFLQMPSDQQESQQRTTYSEPLLKQATLNKQGANIDFVSGATSTSVGYRQSLQSALNQAALS